MGNIKGWTMTTKTLTEEGNNFKEIFLEKMQEEGHITKEQADIMNKYCFVIAEKSFFGKIWDKILWKDNSESINIVVVKVIG
jgi:hypothetical protein